MTWEQAVTAMQHASLPQFRQEELALNLDGVSMDSRTVGPGNLFVCIKGENSDGHDYASAAVQAGAVAVLAEHKLDVPVPLLVTQSSIKALGLLARAWRQRFPGKVVGITGSAGKTTLKEILAQLLSLQGECAKNPLNLNNQIGLPLSMLNTSGKEAFWVMEAGISQAHDMDELGAVLMPDLAIILNVGSAHTMGLGQKGVAHHKAALLKYLRPDGIALVSADYPDLVKEARAVMPSATYFSVTGKQLSYRASYLGLDARERGNYRLWLDGLSLDVNCPLNGPYGAENLIAAAAAAHLFGLDTEKITAGLACTELPVQRFNRKEIPGWHVIDDSYNANPLSCARVLEAVSELARDRDLVCVMGEMLELSEQSEEEHEALGRALAFSGSKMIFWCGGQGQAVQDGLKAEHYAGQFQFLSQVEDFLPRFQQWDQGRISKEGKKEGLILFKGSRGNHLERLVAQFLREGEHHAV